MDSQNKVVTISINPTLYDVIEKLAYFYDQTVEEFVENSIQYDINSQLANNEREIGLKITAKMIRELNEAGIKTW